jgi:drug/metabolite transporter (DMT)-like permease
MDWFLLSLLCAFSLASADAATKRYLSSYRARELVVVRFVVTAILLAPILLLRPLPPLPPAFWAWMALLAPLEVLAMLLYMRAIRTAPLALTLPYLAFTPVFTAAIGLPLLGEAISLQGLAGILLVAAGAYLLNLDSGALESGDWAAPFRAMMREPGARLMLAVAWIYGLTSVASKVAMQTVPTLAFGAAYFVAIGTVTLALFAVGEPRTLRVLGRRPAAHLLVGLAMAVMVITHFEAIARVEAAYMIAVKRTSLLFGILYGAWLFQETRLRRNLSAGLLMLAGVALIAIQ